MGLTNESTGIGAAKEMIDIKMSSKEDIVVALAGNPNTGKSTVFNSLTGLNQHTGNWTGKTVTTAQGNYKFKDKNFVLVDLPGTYSLLSNSSEEEVARDFICFANPSATVIVADATSLERNLNLLLQVLEMTDKVVLCLNLMDEANRKKIRIDSEKLSKKLGIPVICTNARDNDGLDKVMESVYDICKDTTKTNPIKIRYSEKVENIIETLENILSTFELGNVNLRWLALKLIDKDSTILNSLEKYLNVSLVISTDYSDKNLQDEIVETIVHLAEDIASDCVIFENKNYDSRDRKIDKILTSKMFGLPIMLALLALIFWITIKGANYPSCALANFFFWIEDKLTDFFVYARLPKWLHGALVLGVYRTLAWVISVMLPPMAIFFPLFTLLEDLGYLPRVAFNLDNFFKKCCAHGKQALTMCMGFGCNAAGVIGCRIIDSPRERLIAILTNFFVPCNGRFPTLIAISTIFIAGSVSGKMKSVVATLSITFIIILGILMTFLVSKILSKTILKGVPSSFTLELPPYRKPQVGRIIVTSIFDRTIFVLGRAVVVAAPAGLIIWILANINIGNISILTHMANFLNPFANLLGMDGYILMAFILGMPANEIVMPILIMSYMATGSMVDFQNLESLTNLLVSNGWTIITAISVMLFCLMHFPCATTLLTIRKETASVKWTIVAFLLPTIAGICVCFVTTQVLRILL